MGGIAFAAAALLYMVCEELLLDAHDDGQTHVWWIDLQVYLGLSPSRPACLFLSCSAVGRSVPSAWQGWFC